MERESALTSSKKGKRTGRASVLLYKSVRERGTEREGAGGGKGVTLQGRKNRRWYYEYN